MGRRCLVRLAADWIKAAINIVSMAINSVDQVGIGTLSVAWPYFPAEPQQAIRQALEAEGRCASADAPLAWLRLGPPEDGAPGAGQRELRLTMWPGGAEQGLARAHTHGPPVSWLAKTSRARGRRDDQIRILNRETVSENWYKLERVT